jgi:hypothetical protein
MCIENVQEFSGPIPLTGSAPRVSDGTMPEFVFAVNMDFDTGGREYGALRA